MLSIEEQYMKFGETWENNPREYVAAFRGNRAVYEQALMDMDLAAMVKGWDDATLIDVDEAGSDLAFNKTIGKALRKACIAEIASRKKGKKPTQNGMGEDGEQK
jgi:hypothetical protein